MTRGPRSISHSTGGPSKTAIPRRTLIGCGVFAHENPTGTTPKGCGTATQRIAAGCINLTVVHQRVDSRTQMEW